VTIGHGDRGLRSNIPSWLEAQERSDATRYPLIECEFAVQIPRGSNWAVYSGNAFSIRAHYVIGGILRDIVGVESSSSRVLTRVESASACVATSNSFFADSYAARLAQETWDGPTPPGWDDAYWDNYPPLDLIVNLGGENPTNHLVLPLLGFFYAGHAVRHPVLGPDLFDGNGDMEAGTPTGFTLDTAGNATGASTTDAYRGSKAYSLTITNAVNAAGATADYARYRRLLSSTRMVPGYRYRLSLRYKTTNPDLSGAIKPWVGVRVGASWGSPGWVEVSSDGLNTAAWTDVAAANSALYGEQTGGPWRSLLFEFFLPSSGANVVNVWFGVRNTGAAGTSGTVTFDDVRIQRVHRYHDYEDRITAAAIPSVEMASSGVVIGRRNVSLGSVTIANKPGDTEPLVLQLANLLLIRRGIRVVSAGELDGSQLVREDCRSYFYGRVSDVEASDAQVTMKLEDPTADLLETKLPLEKLGLKNNPNSALRDQGYARRMVFGSVLGDTWYRPQRIDKTASTGYGIYELADCTRSPAGLHTLYLVRSYWTGQEALNEKPVSGNMVLVDGTDFSKNLATGRITILRDVRDYAKDRNGNLLPAGLFDFNIGAGNLTAAYTLGSGSATALAAHLTTIFTAAAGTDVTWTYSDTTHLFSCSRGGLTINLLPFSGANAKGAQLLWQSIGFDTKADRSGVGPHVSDLATFTDVDKDHILTVECVGYKDDASGTYTGTPGLDLQFGFEFIHMILRAWLQVPPSKIATASFNRTAVAALAGSLSLPAVIQRMLVASPEPAKDIITRLLQGMVSDLIVDGDGVWTFRPYLDISKIDRSKLRLFTDDDILKDTFRVLQRPGDVFRSVEVTYERYAYGKEVALVTWDIDVPLKYGREEVLALRTHQFTDDVEQAGGGQVDAGRRVGNVYGKMSAGPPLAVSFSVRGRMQDYVPSDRFRLTRSPALAPGGQITDQVFRVVHISHSMLLGVSAVIAVLDVPLAVSGGQS
jgi:hypothetical protein